eukprot:CAMPEP_0119045792 /NCGR_PEP_ID=MMETSP1177-20130426/42636_1 /TAXON_ID=2985 /ORGANISM="Ochromonas sp, Strain CCMP1899" /LENGTH=756 /DNA_ID=CAMNT_0007018153 /DNA_START=508 /DNA_END=2778 /DNA_ORIENTATION=-
MKHGRSILILFGFEFGLLVISVFNLIIRYILHIIDSRLANGLVSKGLYVMFLDLICDALRFITYVFFFSLVFVYYGLPFHIIREVWMAFHTFQKKLSSFIRYIQLTKNLDKRLENATTEEITSAGDCLICREGMETGKKLPCGHVFHLDCIRMWLQHQQSCPLCRADIPVTSSAFDAAAVEAANNAAADANEFAAAGVVANGAMEEARHLTEAIRQWETLPAEERGNRPTVRSFGASSSEEGTIFPCFFVVSSSPAVEVRAEPAVASSLLRSIPTGTVVFVTERVKGIPDSDSAWLQVPDGYIRECAILFGILGPPSLQPFDPLVHLNDLNETRSASALENLLPQPAISVGRPSIQGIREKEKEEEKRRIEREKGPSQAELRDALAHVQSMESEYRSRNIDPTLPADDTNEGRIRMDIKRDDSSPACMEDITSTITGIDGNIATHALAAAKLLRSAFGDTINDDAVLKKDETKGINGSGWGVGTTLDKMIAMQTQMENFSTSLESMHDTVMSCKVVLSQLVDDQVKQYGKIHELRRAIAGSQTGNQSQGNYFLEFSFGRGGLQSSSEGGVKISVVRKSMDSPIENPVGVVPSVVGDTLGVNLPQGDTPPSLSDESTISDPPLHQSSVKVECEDELEDHKVEIGDILEHSSGAALYEQLLSSTKEEDSTIDEDTGEAGGMNNSEYNSNITASEIPKCETGLNESSSGIINDDKAGQNYDKADQHDDKAGQNAAHLKEIRELQAARYHQEMQKKGTSP